MGSSGYRTVSGVVFGLIATRSGNPGSDASARTARHHPNPHLGFVGGSRGYRSPVRVGFSVIGRTTACRLTRGCSGLGRLRRPRR